MVLLWSILPNFGPNSLTCKVSTLLNNLSLIPIQSNPSPGNHTDITSFLFVSASLSKCLQFPSSCHLQTIPLIRLSSDLDTFPVRYLCTHEACKALTFASRS